MLNLVKNCCLQRAMGALIEGYGKVGRGSFLLDNHL